MELSSVVLLESESKQRDVQVSARHKNIVSASGKDEEEGNGEVEKEGKRYNWILTAHGHVRTRKKNMQTS